MIYGIVHEIFSIFKYVLDNMSYFLEMSSNPNLVNMVLESDFYT